MPRLIDISPLVSERIGVWPGDVPFRRRASLAFSNGANIDLSSIETTLHLGAHADAPSHYSAAGESIETRSLDFYYGLCQVVEVRRAAATRIVPADLGVSIEAPRILFKTGTFPDPNRFNNDFVSYSVELIDWLAEKGVRLVGIDTPSSDLFDDPRLEAHQALFRHDMANLEGLILGDAIPGLYTLVAFPLRIEGADASPVRAVLVDERG